MERCEIGRKIVTLEIVSFRFNEGAHFLLERDKATLGSNGNCNPLCKDAHQQSYWLETHHPTVTTAVLRCAYSWA